MKNTVNRIDWNLYTRNSIFNIVNYLVILLTSFAIAIPIISIFKFNISVILFSTLISLILFIISRKMIKYINDENSEEYTALNQSYKIKGKYYFLWYISLNENNELFKEAFNNFKNEKNWYIEDHNIKNLSGILLEGFFVKDTKIVEYAVRENREHWKNNIDTNRLLTYREFLKYKKNKLKIEKLNDMEREIKEFQDYYNLN